MQDKTKQTISWLANELLARSKSNTKTKDALLDAQASFYLAAFANDVSYEETYKQWCLLFEKYQEQNLNPNAAADKIKKLTAVLEKIEQRQNI